MGKYDEIAASGLVQRDFFFELLTCELEERGFSVSSISEDGQGFRADSPDGVSKLFTLTHDGDLSVPQWEVAEAGTCKEVVVCGVGFEASVRAVAEFVAGAFTDPQSFARALPNTSYATLVRLHCLGHLPVISSRDKLKDPVAIMVDHESEEAFPVVLAQVISLPAVPARWNAERRQGFYQYIQLGDVTWEDR